MDIRHRRRAARLSQQRLAELAGCSVAMVRLLEQGLRPARSEVLPRIEAVLAEHEPDAPSPDSVPTNRVGKQAA